MFEFFVSVEIRESVDMEGESYQKLQAAIDAINAWLAHHPALSPFAVDTSPSRAEVCGVNNATLLVAFGVISDDEAAAIDLHQLLSFVAGEAPGSFGMAYSIDHARDDAWTVHILKRGQITVEDDPWFSPVVRSIADAAGLGR